MQLGPTYKKLLTMRNLPPGLAQLRILQEIARRGSASAAARAVHVTQPAATQALAALERWFDAQLFERHGGGMTPTEAGRICVVRIERLLAQIGPLRRTTPAQLRALEAFVEHRGFGAAARVLGLTRSALQRDARELERRLAVPLFEATSHGLAPTREADELARRVRLARVELEQARAEVGGAAGRTVIGAMPLARSRIVPEAVLQFLAAQPDHAVSILDGPYDTLLAALRGGAADVLIGALRGRVAHADVVQQHLFDDPLSIIVRAGHPMARKPSLRTLARAAWIAPRRESPLRRHFDAIFEAAGVASPIGAIECNSLDAARALLMRSDRVMLLSANQILHEIEARQLVALPHPMGRIIRPIGFTTRRDWYPTAQQRALLGALRLAAAAAADQA